MKLSEHFTLHEFERSETASARGIDNKVPPELIPNLKRLCVEILEPLRKYANEPVRISSGYRCPSLNKAVGGVKNSQHLKGQAADIIAPTRKKLQQWYDWIRTHCKYHQLLLEGSGTKMWIHVGCSM